MIGLIFGSSSESLVKTLNDSHGLKDIEGFASIGAFLSAANRKALRCERLVINCVAVGSPQEFRNLRNYLMNHLRTTEVVLFGRYFEPMDLEVVDSFYAEFSEPIYTDYLLQADEQANVDLVANTLCKGYLDDIRLNHSSRKGKKAVVRYGSEPTSSKQKVETGFTPPKPITASGGVVKIFSFGGRFFGKNKLTKAELQKVSLLEREASVVLQLLNG